MSDQQPSAETDTDVVFADTTPQRFRVTSFRDFSRGSRRAMFSVEAPTQVDVPDGAVPSLI
jgi:hypothetical protein